MGLKDFSKKVLTGLNTTPIIPTELLATYLLATKTLVYFEGFDKWLKNSSKVKGM